MEVRQPEGAAQAEQILVGLSKQELINVYDAATVEWLPGKRKPKTRQLNSLAGAGALGGAFWGLLFGILFFVPLLGLAVGAARARWVARSPTPASTTTSSTPSRRRSRRGRRRCSCCRATPCSTRSKDAFDGMHPELIHTNLSDEDEAKLREAFAEED